MAPTTPDGAARRIVLRFHSGPVEILGDGDVRTVRVTDGGGGAVDLAAGMLLRAIGYRGLPVPGLPFDEASGTVPHEGGRVAGLPGGYVVGWIKRGPPAGSAPTAPARPRRSARSWPTRSPGPCPPRRATPGRSGAWPGGATAGSWTLGVWPRSTVPNGTGGGATGGPG